jgi:hypothetical protein
VPVCRQERSAPTTSDSVDGEDVIPGSSYPVAELFRDRLAPKRQEE